MNYKTHFAERLKELMIEHDLIPGTLAEALKINRSTIARYLNGTRQPSVNTFVIIADYFNCTADFLLGFESINSKSDFKKCPPFKEQLKIILDKENINKYQLCKITGIAESAIYDWQRGDNQPSLSNIVQIAKKLNLPVDYVLGRIDY